MSYGDALLEAEALQAAHERETQERVELPDDARTWRSYCVACGDPCSPGQRWCSRSCYRQENLDPEGI